MKKKMQFSSQRSANTQKTMKPKIQETTSAPNAFITALSQIQNGSFVSEIEEKMAQVVRKATDTGIAGELSIKIKVKLNTDGETLSLTPKCTAKVPEKERRPVTFFATEEGRLVRDNPKQPELFSEDSAEVSEGGKMVNLTKAVNQ